VLLVGYEWFTAGDATPPAQLVTGHSEPATKERLIRFFEHLEEELDRNGFMRNAEKRPSMVRNLRNLFQRAQCTEQELRTLHGVVTAFAGPRPRKPSAEAPTPTLAARAGEGGAGEAGGWRPLMFDFRPAVPIVPGFIPRNAGACASRSPSRHGPGETTGTTTMDER